MRRLRLSCPGSTGENRFAEKYKIAIAVLASQSWTSRVRVAFRQDRHILGNHYVCVLVSRGISAANLFLHHKIPLREIWTDRIAHRKGSAFLLFQRMLEWPRGECPRILGKPLGEESLRKGLQDQRHRPPRKTPERRSSQQSPIHMKPAATSEQIGAFQQIDPC